MGVVEQLYEAAGNSGLLKECVWHPSDGTSAQSYPVGFGAAEDTVLDGLTLSAEYAMTYPASTFVGLAQREPVQIDGVTFLVRDIRAVGDGSEMRAYLTKV